MPRPYTWREPVPPPYYIALGSLVGMAAGAAIGAGCYGFYSWYAAKAAVPNIIEANVAAQKAYLKSARGYYESERIATLKYNNNLRPRLLARKVYTSADRYLIRQAYIENQTRILLKNSYKELVREGASLTRAAIQTAATVQKISIAGGIVFSGSILTGASFGYYYLSNFLFDYIPSRLYGN